MYRRCHTAGHGPAHARRGFSPWGGQYRRPKYNVPINISETETGYEVSVYAVGFDKEAIKLSVVDDVLYITGSRDAGEPAPQFTKQEFPVKHFERVVALNGQVDTAGIKARQENGVLFINMPKNAEAQKPAQEISVD